MKLTDLQLEIQKYSDRDMSKPFGVLFEADGKYYQYIDESHAFDGKYSVSFDVHGGLTYGSDGSHILGENFKDWRVIGFDTKHCYDSCENRPDEASVLLEANRLLGQVNNIK